MSDAEAEANADAAQPEGEESQVTAGATPAPAPVETQPDLSAALGAGPGAVMVGREEGDRPSAETPADYAGQDRTGFNATLSLPPELAAKVDASVLTAVPYLDRLCNETYCYLIPRDPKAIYVIWEVGAAQRQALIEKYGANFFSQNRLILRVYQVTGIDFNGFNAVSSFEVDDWLEDKNEYWLDVAGDNDYIAEIGYRAHGTTFFEVVARSNSVRVPKGYPTGAERYNEWGSISVDPNNVEVPVRGEDWRFNQYHYWKNRTHPVPEEKGYWSLVLHQHLPFVHHPEYHVSLEEQWFFEAVISVYTQLLNVFWRLERDKVDFRITVSLTPSLLSMMKTPLLQQRAARHIDECIALATRERDNSVGQPYHDTVQQTLHRFWTAKEVFDAYSGDLTRGYRDFQNLGKLEIITCPATHYLLPFYMHQPEVIRAQLQTACRQYEEAFGRWPRGIWLPENAFTPGLDRFLAAEGIKWFLVNSNGLSEGDTRCYFGTNEPVVTPHGAACFGIDQETRAQVWSREAGYPGHPNYKEWYRDLGYESDWDYLPEYFKTANVRRNTGLKYYRITAKGADLGQKDYYKPLWAEGTVHEQAGQFVYYRGVQANHALQANRRKPCIVSAYDAELFGHWWEEGPAWIESVFRKMLFDQAEVRPVTPSEYLAEQPHHQKLMPGASSWGKKNYFLTWLLGRDYQPNTWVYRHLYRLCGRMADLATKYRDTEYELVVRALNQTARELFLAGASDWGFLIETGQAVRYSELQIVNHLDRCRELMRQIENGEINRVYLATLETADCAFHYRDMDFRVFCRE